MPIRSPFRRAAATGALVVAAAGCGITGALDADATLGALEVAQDLALRDGGRLRFERRRLDDGSMQVQLLNQTGRAIDTLIYGYRTLEPGAPICTAPTPLPAAHRATGIGIDERRPLADDANPTSLIVVRLRYADGSGSALADGTWRGASDIEDRAAPVALAGEVRFDGTAVFGISRSEQYRTSPGTPIGSAPAILWRDTFAIGACQILRSTRLELDATEPVVWRGDSIIGTWRDSVRPHRLRLRRAL